MTELIQPDTEARRIARLRALLLLDSKPEKVFDEIVSLASAICGVPISLISLVDTDRQWFKANIGLETATETPREVAFCAHTICGDAVMEVSDALLDPRFKNNPLVQGNPNIRFYAGAPIIMPDGSAIGTLCVIDKNPHKLDEMQRMLLARLAKLASEAMLLREGLLNDIHTKSQHLASIFSYSGDAIVTENLQKQITSWNPAAEQMFGYSADQMIGQSILKIYPPDRYIEASAHFEKIHSGQDISTFETVRLRKDGSTFAVSITVSPLRDVHGKLMGLSKILRDISVEQQIRQALAYEHERLKVTMDSIGDAVITTDEYGMVQYLNPVAEDLTGWKQEEAAGRGFSEVFHIVNESTRELAVNPLETCLKENRIVALANHTLLLSRDGKEYGIEDSAAPIRDKSGKVLGMVLVFHDVTVQRKMAKEISFRASHDQLTGLLNRHEFETILETTLRNKRSREVLHALLYFDLDRFKVINDTCGHQAGDQVLKEITRLVSGLIRTEDAFARMGGDEFAILLKSCPIEMIDKIADQIRLAVSDYRYVYADQTFRLAVSIGIALIHEASHDLDKDALIQAADMACLSAKDAGRDRVHYHSELAQTVQERISDAHWAARIEQAIDNDKFILYYQKIVPVDGDEEGMHGEVLVRMRDEQGQLIVLPSAFMRAAERYQLVSRIDLWVIKNTLDWLEEHAEFLEHTNQIAINVSGQSLADPMFLSFVNDLIAHKKVNFNKLCFEITETAAINNLSSAVQFITAMKLHGIKFALDDFGSGVSSFGYLKSLNVDYLKIDGIFIRNLANDTIDRATVQCIVDMAKTIGKKTVAEWVDNPESENILRGMNVDFLQGFSKHKPESLREMQYR